MTSSFDSKPKVDPDHETEGPTTQGPDAMRSTPVEYRLNKSREGLRDWLHQELERRAVLRHTLRIEEYRNLLPTNELEADDWLGLVEHEYRLRRGYGERPSIEEYLARFPDLRDGIAANFAIWVLSSDGSPGSIITRRLHGSGSSPWLVPDPVVAPNDLTVPGYEILEIVGRGGMGVVYKAMQKGLNRLVALKMILNHTQAALEDHARFRYEAEAVARLKHPNIVQVFEIGEWEGRPFFTLEYLPGGNLHQFLKGKPQAPEFAARLTLQLAQAIDHAHQHGILHRDLKPANILLQLPIQTEGETPGSAPSGNRLPQLKIADFGLAKQVDNNTHLTQTGTVAGTPHYMAPEQVRAKKNEKLSWPVDVYGLGAILYEMLTGQRPFQSEHPVEVMNQVLNQNPVPPRRIDSKIPRDLETICLKCLEKRADQRYPSATELAADLERFLTNKPIEARPIGALSQSWRWCRRNPVVAGLLFATLMTFAVSLFVVTVLLSIAEEQRALTDSAAKKAREQQILASQKATEAEAERLNAEKQTEEVSKQAKRHQRELYASRMLQVQSALDHGNLRRAREILQTYEPFSYGAADFRSFEWHYLHTQSYERSIGFDIAQGCRSIAISPKGDSILAASLNGGALFDLRNHHRLRDFASEDFHQMHEFRHSLRYVRWVAYSPDAKFVATSSPARPLQVWEASTGKLRFSVEREEHEPGPIAFSPDGRWIALGICNYDNITAPGKVRFFEVTTGKQTAQLDDFDSGVVDMAFSPDGSRFATVTRRGMLCVWNWSVAHAERRVGTFAFASALAWSPRDSEIAVGHLNGTITCYDPRKLRETRRVSAHFDTVETLAFSGDGEFLASGGRDTLLRIWDGRSMELFRSCRGHEQPVRSVAFDPVRNLLFSSSLDGSVRGWQYPNDPARTLLQPGVGLIVRAKISCDGKRLLILGEMGDVSSYHLETGEILAARGATGERLDRAVRVVPDPTRKRSLVLNHDRDPIWQWGDDGSPPTRLSWPNLGPELINLAVSPDGKLLATLHDSGLMQIHSFETGKKLNEFKVLASSGRAFAFHPQHPDRIILGCYDGTVRVWQTDGTPLDRFELFQSPVVSFAFDREGKQLLSASDKGVAILIDLASGKRIQTVRTLSGTISGIAFSPDQRRIVTAGSDCRVRLWDIETGEETLSLGSHNQGIDQVLFGGKGRQLISVGNDWSVTIWNSMEDPYRDFVRRYSLSAAPQHIQLRQRQDDQTLEVVLKGQNRSRENLKLPESKLTSDSNWVHSVELSYREPDGSWTPLGETTFWHRSPKQSLAPDEHWDWSIPTPLPQLDPGSYRLVIHTEWRSLGRSEEFNQLSHEFEVRER
jgi:serine/threonine protein kinase/WD40 repeat protein